MLDDLVHTPSWEWSENAKGRLLEALAKRSDDVKERAMAASLASEITDDEVASALLERVLDANEDDEVRGAAAIALGPSLELCDVEGFDDDYSEPPLSRAVFDRITSALERAYRDGAASVLVRRRALEAAVRAPMEWQSAAIKAAWASNDRDWRLTAVFCAGYVPDVGSIAKEALETDDPQLVLQVVRAAANGMPDVVKAAERTVLRFARDASTPREVRLDAIEALGNLQSDEALEILEELSESSDDEIAGTAEEALLMRNIGGEDDLDW